MNKKLIQRKRTPLSIIMEMFLSKDTLQAYTLCISIYVYFILNFLYLFDLEGLEQR